MEKYENLLDFRKPSRADLSVVLFIDSEQKTLGLGEIYRLGKDKGGSIQIKKIGEDYIEFSYTGFEKDKEVSKTEKLKDNVYLDAALAISDDITASVESK